MADPIHASRTRKSGYRYMFLAKHHGGGTSDDARWLPDLSRDQEFSVFDAADFHEVTDEANGWLYGVLRDTDGDLVELGTWHQEMAEFPQAREGEPWHGYPIWAVNEEAPSNRASQKLRPAKAVFRRMEAAGLITSRQR